MYNFDTMVSIYIGGIFQIFNNVIRTFMYISFINNIFMHEAEFTKFCVYIIIEKVLSSMINFVTITETYLQ